MKRLGLSDVDALRPRYIAELNKKLADAFEKPIGEIVKADPTLDQNAMGSVNFLEMYCSEHPDTAFIVTSAHSKDPWIILNASKATPPKNVYRIMHSGSLDGGHFEPGPQQPGDIMLVALDWETRCRRTKFPNTNAAKI